MANYKRSQTTSSWYGRRYIMIFHTATDETYYNKFYSMYSNSIIRFYPQSKLSLFFMGNNLPVNSNIEYLKQKNISFESIKETYSVNEIDAKGYYALARWLSMPIKNQNVVVSDVDIIAIKPIPQQKIDDIFKEHQIINITRTKPNGSEGGMAMMYIRKDVVEDINLMAEKILHKNNLRWDLDVQVRTYIYNTYKVAEIPEMHVFSKRSDYTTYDNTNRSYAIFKGRIDAKFNSLSKATQAL